MGTKDELYEEAKSLDVEGRSEMSKAELEAAIASAKETRGRADLQEATETNWSRGDGTVAPTPPDDAAIERSWSRGADLEDAGAVAVAAEEARIANLGSTGGPA